MKKYIIIILLAGFLGTTMGASNADAAAATAGTFYLTTIQMGATTTLVYNLSKNVKMQYANHLSGTVADAYTACTYHSSGDRVLGSGSVDQKVYYKEEAAFSATYTTTNCAAPANATTSKFANQAGWSAL